MHLRSSRLVPALCLVLTVLPAGCSRDARETARVPTVSGNIEVVDAQLGFKIAGRVAERLVSEGDKVKQGQLVARLDDVEQTQQLTLRRAELAAAEAVMAELRAGSRPQEIAAAEAALQSAEAERDRSKLEQSRQQDLHAKRVISDRELEIALAQLKVSEARVREAAERAKLVREGPRAETIQQAQARIDQASAAVALAETQLSYVRLLSPLEGRVLSHNIEAGEYVSPGTPLLTVADTLHLWVRAYIAQTDMGRVKLGQKVRVRTDSFPGKFYEGVVGFIASEAEFTPKTVQTPKERVKLVFRIKVYLTNTEDELRPGMPADVLFD